MYALVPYQGSEVRVSWFTGGYGTGHHCANVRRKRSVRMSVPFASTADISAKEETFETLADGVYALTAQGDPNVCAVEAEDFLVCFEARATPVAARRWLDQLRE